MVSTVKILLKSGHVHEITADKPLTIIVDEGIVYVRSKPKGIKSFSVDHFGTPLSEVRCWFILDNSATLTSSK
jgi:hypothetical protein